MRRQDVWVGGATLPVHEDGGWALPGGGRTMDQLEAMAVAAELAALMPTEAPKKPRERVVRQTLTLTRRAAENDRLVHSRV